jgi:hypothetical protein
MAPARNMRLKLLVRVPIEESIGNPKVLPVPEFLRNVACVLKTWKHMMGLKDSITIMAG